MHMRHSRRWACALLALTLALAPAGCAVQQDLTPVLEAGTPADSAAPSEAAASADPSAGVPGVRRRNARRGPCRNAVGRPLCRAPGDARRNPCCDAVCIPAGHPIGIAGG